VCTDRATDLSRICGTSKTREDTEGHDRAAIEIQKDPVGNGGIREDTTSVGFGTVRRRVPSALCGDGTGLDDLGVGAECATSAPLAGNDLSGALARYRDSDESYDRRAAPGIRCNRTQ
jgi:hypothetical protein